MSLLTRATAMLLGSIALACAGAAAADAAPYICPAGWTSTTANPIGNVTKFCEQAVTTGSPPSGAGKRYYIEAVSADVGQFMKRPDRPLDQPWGSATNPQPVFNKYAVGNWFNAAANEGYHPVIMLNGSFFVDTGLTTTTSALSFPTYQTGLVNTGKSTDDEWNYRRCFSWAGFESRATPWTFAGSDWTGVSNYMSQNCLGAGYSNSVVALDPNRDLDNGGPNALTYLGRKGGNGQTLCFFVGGWQNRATARTIMSQTFGCSPQLQLDGGHSTELAYMENGTKKFVINGYGAFPVRSVPHVLAIY